MGNEKIFAAQDENKKIEDKVDIRKYEDPTGLSAKNLDLGLWVANNKRAINKIIIFVLGLAGFLMISYSLYGYFYYFTFGREQELILTQQDSGLNLLSYREANSAKEVELLSVQVLSKENSYDLTAKVRNPNPKHHAGIDYCFILDSEQKCGQSFLLPGEEKLIVLPNQKTQGAFSEAKFKINEVNWQRLNAKNIPDWESYKNDRLDFSVKNLKVSNYNNLSYLEFDISNDSAFSYYDVPLNIVARGNSGNIVAVNRYVLTDFKNGENKSVRLYWPGLDQYSSSVEVMVDLDILSPNIYKPYKEY